MWPFNSQQRSSEYTYLHVVDGSENGFEAGKVEHFQSPEPYSRWHCRAVACFSIVTIALATGFIAGSFMEKRGMLYLTETISITHSSQTLCHNPDTRHEWRSLSLDQKHEYLDAVQCLRHIPSALNPNMSLYDDFPFLHNTIGDYGTWNCLKLTILTHFLTITSSYGCPIFGMAQILHSLIRESTQRAVWLQWYPDVSKIPLIRV